MFRIQSKNLK